MRWLARGKPTLWHAFGQRLARMKKARRQTDWMAEVGRDEEDQGTETGGRQVQSKYGVR